jgi:hypothetical protein
VDDYERRRELARLRERRRRPVARTRPGHDAPTASRAQRPPHNDDRADDAEPDQLLQTLKNARTVERSAPDEPSSYSYDRDRRLIALIMLALIGLIPVLYTMLVMVDIVSEEKFSDFAGSLTASLVSLLATVVGFYFAKKP